MYYLIKIRQVHIHGPAALFLSALGHTDTPNHWPRNGNSQKNSRKVLQRYYLKNKPLAAIN